MAPVAQWFALWFWDEKCLPAVSSNPMCDHWENIRLNLLDTCEVKLLSWHVASIIIVLGPIFYLYFKDDIFVYNKMSWNDLTDRDRFALRQGEYVERLAIRTQTIFFIFKQKARTKILYHWINVDKVKFF